LFQCHKDNDFKLHHPIKTKKNEKRECQNAESNENEGVSKFLFSALRAEIQQIITNQTLFNLLVLNKLIIC
jgi:uncharacterized protein (DUF1778 family)